MSLGMLRPKQQSLCLPEGPCSLGETDDQMATERGGHGSDRVAAAAQGDPEEGQEASLAVGPNCRKWSPCPWSSSGLCIPAQKPVSFCPGHVQVFVQVFSHLCA